MSRHNINLSLVIVLSAMLATYTCSRESFHLYPDSCISTTQAFHCSVNDNISFPNCTSLDGSRCASMTTSGYLMSEICDNGIDDDGDGLIDWCDDECNNGQVISGNSVACPGDSVELTVTVSGGVGPYQYAWSSSPLNQAVVDVVSFTTETHSVTITDANGCTDTASFVLNIEDCDGKICFIGTNNSTVFAETQYTIVYAENPVDDKVIVRTTFSKNFVDNTYGVNAIGWPSGQDFDKLVGSDHLVVSLEDGNANEVMELKLDYITADGSAPSGYSCLGVWGGDGDVLNGNVSDVLSAVSSIDKNFNEFGYVLTTDSPVTDTDYTPDPNYPEWIYEVWYEVEVKLSAFGSAGFGSVNITGIHASPSKTGNNTELVAPGDCCLIFDPKLTASAGYTCSNLSDSIDLEVTDGDFFLWNTGDTTSMIRVKPSSSQTYTVTTTDEYGCDSILSYYIDVFAPPSPGQISGDEAHCGPFDPGVIADVISPTGIGCDSSILQYQWQRKVNGGVWRNIPGATGISYDPDVLSVTTQYRRHIPHCCDTIYSNVVTKTVNKIPSAISGEDKWYCVGDSISLDGDATFITDDYFGFLIKSVHESTNDDKISFEFGNAQSPKLHIYLDGSNTPLEIDVASIARIEQLQTDHNHDDPKIGYDSNNGSHRSLLDFAIPNISGIVDSAKVVLVSKNSGNIDVGIYSITEDWDPANVTWNEKVQNVNWTFAGALHPDGELISITNITDVGTYSLDVSSFISNMFNPATPSGLEFLWDNGQVAQNIIVPPLGDTSYTLTVTDTITGCFGLDTITIDEIECGGQLCFIGTSNTEVFAESQYEVILDENPAESKVRVRTIFSKNFVDNTYGTNAIGWSGGQTFNNLVGSDHLILSLYDANNVLQMEVKMDYLSSDPSALSGYASLGVSGGDGNMEYGDVNDVISVVTSLDKNLNEFGYPLTVNSPATDSNYTINSTYPNWIYDVWYEVEVKLDAFGTAGFGSVDITGIHASPSKTGNNTELVAPGNCCVIFKPTIIASGTELCVSGTDSMELFITEGDLFNWSTGDTTKAITVKPDSTQTYSVTVTDQYGCDSILSYTVEVFTVPSAGQIIGDESHCGLFDPGVISDVISPSGIGCDSSALVYQWQRRREGGNWVDIEGATGLTYDPDMLSITTEYRRYLTNCCGTVYSNVVTKTIDKIPLANAGEDNFYCVGDSINLSASASFYATEYYGFLIKSASESTSDDYIRLEHGNSLAPKLEIYQNGNSTPTVINVTEIARIQELKPTDYKSDPKVGYKDTEGANRSLFKFDISAITGSIDSAKVIIVTEDVGDLDIGIYDISENWIGSNTNWNARMSGVNWSVPGATNPVDLVIDVITITNVGEYSMDVSDAISQWVNPVTPPGLEFLWSDGQYGMDITVPPLGDTSYFLTVTDTISGCYGTDTMSVNEIECGGQFCFIGTSNTEVFAESQYEIILEEDPAESKVRVRTIFSKNFVDNTYGTNAIGWPSGQQFDKLVGSDHLIVSLLDANDNEVMELKMDYISADGSTPSGYSSLGVWGGDGDVLTGNAADVLSVVTSLDKNFNEFGHILTVNSPATDTNYTTNPTYPNWIYEVWYEVEVKLDAFGTAGFGSANITGIHASPSKTGNNTELVAPGNCCLIFEPTIISSGTELCASGTDSIDLFITEGDYFSWSSGETTKSITVKPDSTQTYTVTVTDQYGCDTTLNFTLDIFQLFTPGQISGDQFDCGAYDAGIISSLQDPIGIGCNSAALVYQWQEKVGAGAWTDISGANGLTYDPGVLATTTIFRRVTMSCCDTLYSNEVTKTVYPAFSANAGDDQTYCLGDTVTLTASPVAGATYAWFEGGTVISNQSTYTFNPTITTTYTLAVQNYGCVKTDDIQITINQPATPGQIDGDETICGPFDAQVITSVVDPTGSDCGGGIDSTGYNTCEMGDFPISMSLIFDASSCGNSNNNQGAIGGNWNCQEYNGGLNGTTISSQISTSSDDAEEAGPDTQASAGPGAMYFSSSDLEIIDDSDYAGTQKIGLRFNNLALPNNIIITNAYIEFTAIAPDVAGGNSGAVNLTISAQDVDDAPAFGSADYYLSNLTKTSNSANWIPEAWTAEQTYTTSDISSVVQEIVDRAGWSSGNDIAFVIDGSGSRSAYSYDNTPGKAPVLFIEYEFANPPTQYYIVTNDDFSGTVNVNEEFSITNSGSALSSPLVINIYDTQGGTLLQTVEMSTDCGAPIIIGDQFGSVLLYEVEYNNGLIYGGGSGLQYQWQSMDDGVNWVDIAGADSLTYDPGILNTTTLFRRVAMNCCDTAFSNEITKTVLLVPTVDVGPDLTVCPGVETQLNGTSTPAGMQLVWSTGETGSTILVNPIAETSYIFTSTDTSTGCFATDTVVLYMETNNCEICDNGIDDDGDGLIDCADSDCGLSSLSISAAVEQFCDTLLGGAIALTIADGLSPFTYYWSDITEPTSVWAFNESTNDITGNGNDQNASGSLGSPVYSIDAKEGSHSLSLDGSTYLRYSQDGAFMESTLDQWMLSFWMKPSSLSGIQYVFDEGGSSNGLAVRLNNDTLEFAVRNGGVQVNANSHLVPNDGNWHHVLAFYENDSIGLYLDGIKSNNVYCGFPGQQISAHSSDGGIGQVDQGSAFGNTSGDFYAGLLDDVRYYANNSFTNSQINDLAVGDGNRTNLPAGSYDVSVKDAFGRCYTESGITIGTNNLSVIAGNDTTICIGLGTIISAAASNGFPPYSYEWSHSLGTGTSKTVNPMDTTTYWVTVTDAKGCERTDDVTVNVNPDITVAIDYNGSVCLEENSTISAEALGGSGNYVYSWTGPNGFTSAMDTISIVDDGNYYVTVSDEYGCETSTSGFVYQAYQPFILTLNTTVCEGESVNLDVNSPSAVAYQWDSDAGNATTSSVTVTPAPPSTTYNVTVTNDLGCQTTASVTINVDLKPVVNVTGPSAICIGETSQLSPTSGGTWISTNSSVAVVSANGEVTAVGPGTVSFIFTDNTTNCDSDPTTSITVHPKPVVNITGPTEICIGFQTTLSPTTGGSWVSTDPAVATVDNNGVVTAINAGTANFIFTDTNTTCSSDQTTSVTINPTPITNYTGNDSICIGGISTLSPTSGGTWSSLDPSIATIDNNGNITGVSDGTVRFLFTNTATSCVSDTTLLFTVLPDPIVSITGPSSICVDNTTSLSPTSGGTWVSSNPAIATVSNSGVVTGISGGIVNFTFTSDFGCVSPATADITVDSKVGVTISGENEACMYETVQLTASRGGGTWMSNDPAVASVSSSGLVTPIMPGNVEIIYEHNSGACSSESSFTITFHATPVVNISGSDSICVGSLTTLNPSTGGTWVSSDPAIATVSNDGIVVGLSGGTANFTYTNNTTGCVSNQSADIEVSPELGVVIDFVGSICLEDTTKLTANHSGGTAPLTINWTGPSGFTSTLETIDISLDGNYYVTVTDAFGCQVNTSAFVYERYEPFIFGLNTEICEGESITISINSSSAVSYQWGPNANNATTSSVTVTPTFPSTNYNVSVTNDIGCVTTASATALVIEKPDVGISGTDSICEGETTDVIPNIGGTWISSNNGIATVNDMGLVTGISGGSATFSFQDTSTGCWSDPTAAITVTDNGIIAISGDTEGCIGTSFQLTPSVAGGIWTSNNNTIASVDSTGLVTGVSAGSISLQYNDNSPACLEVATVPVTIYNDPTVGFTGPMSICIGSTSSLTPNTGGTWTSSDDNVATVSNSGIITAVGGGTALFTFISDNAGCSATTTNPINVHEDTDVSLNGPASLCIGFNTSLLPSSGGIWISSDNGIASVNSSGTVLAKAGGIATFTFYESTNGCVATETIDIEVYPVINPSFTGPDTICIGDTSYISPASGGNWVSDNTSAATIDSFGMIVGIGAGNAKFTYTNNTTGCVSTQSQTLLVQPKPAVSLLGQNDVCIGGQVTISPTTGGVWESQDPTVATINNMGLVTGISQGTTSFIFTDAATSCSSDPTAGFTVNAPTTAGFNGPSDICIGDTTSLYPSSGGSWTSNNLPVATITTDGKITGVGGGSATFTFVNTFGCTSGPNATLSVLPGPSTNLIGANGVCIGGKTYFSPTTGGTWVSNDTTIATITNSGEVTGVSQGTTSFVFTNSTTGCSSLPSAAVTVYSDPIAQITGASDICIGSSTNMSPSSGGMWTSNNPSIAGISSSGIVTGYAVGQATFTYVENGTGCSSAPSQPVTVSPKPIVQITGSNNICEGSNTTLSPTSGGTWSSTNPSIASVDNSGNVTGLAQGIARFIFTSDQGCDSEQTAPVLVYGKPTIYNPGSDDFCVGDSITLLPTSGGIWTSSDTTVATITNGGVVAGMTAGTVRFTYMDNNTGCESDSSDLITVNDKPVITILGNDTICIGSTTQLAPTAGGLWYSNNPSIASITNAGIASGVSAGTATFYFQNSATNCNSENSAPVTIEPKPIPQFAGDSEICVGESTTILPSSGGTWQSDNPAVATINNSGFIQSISSGLAKFKFNETGSCSSDWSTPLTVYALPSVGFVGPPVLCQDDVAQLYPATGGTWVSSDTSVATVDSNGTVYGVSDGFTFLTFTQNSTGCSSNGNLKGTVIPPPDISVVGDVNICVGYTTDLNSTSSGIWHSSDTRIATVSNNGIVTGKAPGKVIIELIDAVTGCSSGSNSVEITVDKCINHDFNVTTTTLPAEGDVSTNDNIANSTYNTNPVIVSKPSGSSPVITMNSDGTYTFTASVAGKYIYRVEVCNDVVVIGCPTTTLEITVLGNIYGGDNLVNNLEIYTVIADADPLVDGASTFMNALANDRCVNSLDCSIDTSSLSILDGANFGSNMIDVFNRFDYYPYAGNLGEDTIKYEVCNAEGNKCASGRTFITISHPSKDNSVVASDDFRFTMSGATVGGNVMANDSDPEGDSISVVPSGSAVNPIIIPEGSYFIESDGNYSFTPDSDFAGGVNIVYTLCDDNAVQKCMNATLHILVAGDMSLNIRVYLEGALILNGGETSSSGRPLMRDDLRNSPYTGLNYIPVQDPYMGFVGLLDLSTQFEHVGPGALAQNSIIQDSAGVFGIQGENAIVDWVFVQIRDKNDNTNVIATRSGLLQRDGDIVDLDGASPLKFTSIGLDSFYVVVKHRSHLGVMSGIVSNTQLIDFTSPGTWVFDFGTTLGNGMNYTGLAQKSNVVSGYKCMWAGDFDASGKVKFTNPGDDQNILFADVLFHPDNTLAKANYDFGYGYYQGDYDMNAKVKFVNPNDDKNMLFSQLLLYPLNASLLDNFNFLIEQVPDEGTGP